MNQQTPDNDKHQEGSWLTRWARARMAPETWDTARHAAATASESTRSSYASLRRWASIGSDQVTSMRDARIEPWRLIFSASTIAIPLLIIMLIAPDVDLALITPLLVISVTLATYVADWVGGATAIISAVLLLDLLLIGDRWSFDAGASGRDVAIILLFLLLAGAVASTIERLKYDQANARLDAAAMRAANTALNAVEIAAAQRPAGNNAAYVSVFDNILTAMVRVNRASTGSIYLTDHATDALVQIATYGADETAAHDDHPSREVAFSQRFVGRVAQERRPIAIYDTRVLPPAEIADVEAVNIHVRSVLGVPLIGPEDRVVGVAWVGLYAPYRFAQTATARLEALAHRAVAFMESASIADAQEELLGRISDSHKRLQSVIQAMPEAVMVVRPPLGLIVASNAAAARMFRLPANASPFSMRVDQLRMEGDLAPELHPIAQALATGETVAGVELSVHQPGGDPLPVIGSAAPLRADDGAIDAIVGVFQDVRPLKEAERMRDEFISVVSHELRSPLTPIRGFAQIVARDLVKEGGHDQHVQWLETLQRHADRMTRLVDDLLDVSRLRAGRLAIRRNRHDIVTIARRVVDSANTSNASHQVELVSAWESYASNVDEDRIHQIIDNLVGNAVKYTDGGTITVAVGPSNRDEWELQIAVSDQGHGIPEAEREQLFNPFYRRREASESAKPGLGLGLFICAELASAHGGTIEIEDSPSGGTTFVVLLEPVRAEEATHRPAA
ncbi:MAG: GAF domain-containing protein [Chloroflexia bacterium]|jgi:signal transduction histidine kinase|nr:GAF domain-containing protein [Chloroflexia bacterium]MDQ3614394.1 ATP-binding protein [Chloroflexota bacterium]